MVAEGSQAKPDSGELAQESGARELDKLKAQTVNLKELLGYLAQLLVTEPDAVDVRQSENDDGTVLELRVAKCDLGRVIGKQGRTARSLRTLLNAAASRTNQKVTLEIVEERDAEQ